MIKSIVILIFIFLLFYNRYFLISDDYGDNSSRKILKIWLPKWLLYILETSVWLVFFISLYYLINFEQQSIFLIGISLFDLIVTSLYFYWTRYYNLKYSWKVETIKNINKDGFEIHHYKNGRLKNNRQIKWNDISRIKLTYNLDILLNNGEWINIDTKTEHYHQLLKILPTHLPKASISQIREKFRRLKSCKICGSIAVDYKTCEACGTAVWNSTLKKSYDNPMNYVRAKQLDLFASLHKNSLQRIAFSSNDTFELDKNWQPMVTQEEIIKQSKKLIWVL